MSAPLGVVVHFEHGNGVTEYLGWNFNSMARIGNSYFAAGPDGLCKLGGSTDNGEGIYATVDTGGQDFGTPNAKRVRSIHLGGEFTGEMAVTVTADGTEKETYDVHSPDLPDDRNIKVPVGRNVIGRYWRLRLENTDGAPFSLDGIDVIYNTMSRRR